MSTNLRRLGVYGDNLPTKKAVSVEPSDFLIGGIVGKFERNYKKAFLVNNPTEFRDIFGDQVDSATYGNDAVTGFFNNVVGVDAKAYIKGHVGFVSGSTYDGVTATANVADGTPATVLQLDSAYQNELEFGTSGNRTGYKIERGYRFSTQANGTAAANATSCVLDSVIGIKVGDIVEFSLTGGGAASAYHKIATVVESTKTITWTDGDLHASKTLADNDIVRVQGFRLRTYRKSLTGIVNEVDTELGKIYCTTESAVTDFYAPNVFAISKWLKVTRMATTPATLDLTLPAAVSNVTYLASGAAGTAPTTSTHWAPDLTALDNLPVRFIANPESTDRSVQLAIETYCRGRTDTPKAIFNIGANKTKDLLITEGSLWQRSDDVLGTIVADWVKVTDPFSTSAIAPARSVPNVGHVMGVLIRTIGLKGVHYIPQKDTPIFGITGLDNSNIETIGDLDRTDIAEAGINIIQNVRGYGFIIRNMFTPSIATEFQFLNGMIMRDYIKISAVDSLQGAENQPNTFARITANRDAIFNFLLNIWYRGTTGNVPEGESYGQSFDAQGNPTTYKDHFQVRADLINNPQSAINLGQQNVDVYFTYPAPAGSIKIGVGILLRS
jgi:hypothetical protein